MVGGGGVGGTNKSLVASSKVQNITSLFLEIIVDNVTLQLAGD